MLEAVLLANIFQIGATTLTNVSKRLTITVLHYLLNNINQLLFLQKNILKSTTKL